MKSSKTTVVNIYKEPFDIYIGRGRGSKWGNPFVIGKDGTREDVIAKYKLYLWEQMKVGNITRLDLLELDNQRLGCFCKPQACHGDVIAKAVEWVKGLS